METIWCKSEEARARKTTMATFREWTISSQIFFFLLLPCSFFFFSSFKKKYIYHVEINYLLNIRLLEATISIFKPQNKNKFPGGVNISELIGKKHIFVRFNLIYENCRGVFLISVEKAHLLIKELKSNFYIQCKIFKFPLFEYIYKCK